MTSNELKQLKKELEAINNQKVEVENVSSIPYEQEISKKKKVKNLQCTLMFVDMCSSTKMQDDVGRKNMVKTYKMFARLVAKAVEEHKGRVMQIVGDGILCLFINNKINSENSTIESIKAIGTYIDDVYNKLVEKNREIKASFGVCSGHVYITRVGVNGKGKCCQLAFPSDITNHASKQCDLASDDQTIIDRNTYDKLSSNNQKLFTRLKNWTYVASNLRTEVEN